MSAIGITMLKKDTLRILDDSHCLKGISTGTPMFHHSSKNSGLWFQSYTPLSGDPFLTVKIPSKGANWSPKSSIDFRMFHG
jgi:hypothetical protein